MNNTLKNWAGNQVLRTQNLLTSIGERLKWSWLIYNPLVTLGFARAARRNAPIVIDSILSTFDRLVSVRDYGCGLGIYVEEFARHGVDAIGLEYNPRYRSIAELKNIRVLPWDLNQKDLQGYFPNKCDLAICLEVAEHIPISLAEQLVHVLVSSASRIVFTAACPGQGGTGHINEQPREYWIEKFASAGATYSPQLTSELAQKFVNGNAFPYLSNNLSVFLVP